MTNSNNGIPEQLNPVQICRMAKKIGRRWKELALYLDYKDADIERFIADHSGDLCEQIRNMLGEWVQKNAGEDLVSLLVEALRETGLSDVALWLQNQTP